MQGSWAEEEQRDMGLSSAGGALGTEVGAGDDEGALCASLFRGVNVFLSREVPREPLALVIRCVTHTYTALELHTYAHTHIPHIHTHTHSP